MELVMTPRRILERACKLFPRKEAIHCGHSHHTYAEFGDRVNRLSHALSLLGVRQGDRFAFLSPNCHRLLEAYFAAPMLGAILVPLNIRLSASELAFILDDAGVGVLFVHPDLEALASQVAVLSTTPRHIVPLWSEDRAVTTYDSLIDGVTAGPYPSPPIRESDVVEIFYTSGTTGRPKGVMLSHRNVYALALQVAAQLPVTESDVFLHSLPMYHANGWGGPHTATFMGASHVIVPYPRAELVAQAARTHGVTLAYMVPTMVIQLLNHRDVGREDLTSLTRLVVGGSAPSPALARTLAEDWGCRLIGAYGLTEHSPVATFAQPPSFRTDMSPDEMYRLMCTAGQPMAGVEVRVVNETGKDVPADGHASGEVWLRSDTVMVGYWNRPDATISAIQDGWLRTGDIGTITPDGFLDIVDRMKDVIVSGGENISSIEIENALYEHPAVLECAIIAIPDDYWGERPLAFVVPKEGDALDDAVLRQWCEARLSRFKIPASFRTVTELPKTGTGKIQKNVLRREFWGNSAKQVH